MTNQLHALARRLKTVAQRTAQTEQAEPVYVEYYDEDSDTTGMARVFTTGDQQVLLYLPEIEDGEA